MSALPLIYFVVMALLVAYVVASSANNPHRIAIRMAARGDLEKALAAANQDPSARWILNDVINFSITFGHYKNAIAAEAHESPAPSKTELEASNHVLIQINLAEAEYNLGDWTAAERRLASLDAAAEPFDICRAGLRAQRAWIFAHTGRAREALSIVNATDPSWLPFDFRAEYWFTVARIALVLGDHAECQEALDSALRTLVRPSSKRNFLFLQARLAEATGHLRTAAQLCEEAANQPYKGQGADGLVLWGDLLTKLGDHAGANRAWQLAIDRDGESEWAQRAQERLSRCQEATSSTADLVT